MAQYSKAGDGHLKREELAVLMKDIAKGMPPTEDEVSHILKQVTHELDALLDVYTFANSDLIFFPPARWLWGTII